MHGAVAFVDCETTGLDPDHHEIWEVGLITPVVGATGAEDGWNEQIWQLPVDLSKADPMALNIGRFHDRRLLGIDLVPLAVFAAEFARDTRGLHLAGACVSFDAERLWQLLRNNGECPMWHYHLIDVEGLAAGYLTGQFTAIQECGANPDADGPTQEEAMLAIPPWNSGDLSRAVGVEPDDFDRHTALGDARWAKAIYEAVMGGGT